MNKTTILAVLACFTLVGCGGSDGEGPTNLSPKVTITAPSEAASDEMLEIAAQASDSDGTIVSYKWQQTAGPDLGVDDLTTTTFSVQPVVDSDTIFSFEVTVTDNDGSIAKAVHSVSVLAPVFQVPVITLNDNYDVLEGGSIEVSPTLIVDGDLTYSLDWAVTNTQSLTHTAVADALTVNTLAVDQDTVVTISVTLTDSESQTAEASFTVTVKNEIIATVEQAIINLERTGKLPVLDTSSTIAGVDENDDGLRDDVANYIQSLTITTSQKEELVNAAKNIQAALLVDTTNDLLVSAIGEQSALSAVCIALSFDKAIDAHRYLAKLEALMANTPARVIQYDAYNAARHGSVTRLPDFSACM